MRAIDIYNCTELKIFILMLYDNSYYRNYDNFNFYFIKNYVRYYTIFVSLQFFKYFTK